MPPRPRLLDAETAARVRGLAWSAIIAALCGGLLLAVGPRDQTPPPAATPPPRAGTTVETAAAWSTGRVAPYRGQCAVEDIDDDVFEDETSDMAMDEPASPTEATLVRDML